MTLWWGESLSRVYHTSLSEDAVVICRVLLTEWESYEGVAGICGFETHSNQSRGDVCNHHGCTAHTPGWKSYSMRTASEDVALFEITKCKHAITCTRYVGRSYANIL